MEKLFKIKQRGSTVRAEVLGGLTTFFAMAYIIFVNPSMLCVDLGDGFYPAMPKENIIGVAVATCLSAVIGTLLTGFLANVPYAQAPGMGLNAFFTYTVCLTMGCTWQQALTIVFISGLIFLIVAISPIRKKIIESIPASLKAAISAGSGLFIAFIGLLNSKLVNFSSGVPALGDITHGAQLLCVIGILIIVVLMVLQVKGAIFIGILATAVIGLVPSLLGWNWFGEFVTEGSAYDLASIGDISKVAFQFDFAGVFSNGVLPFITAVISFALVDCFDTVGTLIGTASAAGLLEEDGSMDGGDKAMIADAVATVSGSALGTSTVTTFVESASRISEGARTGLSSIVVAYMFALSLFITPVFGVLGNNSWFLYAITAPALIVVGTLMMKSVARIAWDKMEEAVPCFLTIAMMPFAYSISDGIAFGFISYVVIKLFRGKAKEVPVLMYIISVLFLAKYVLMNLKIGA